MYGYVWGMFRVCVGYVRHRSMHYCGQDSIGLTTYGNKLLTAVKSYNNLTGKHVFIYNIILMFKNVFFFLQNETYYVYIYNLQLNIIYLYITRYSIYNY